jgi:hypothetical protein
VTTNAEGDGERFQLIPTEVIEAWAKGEYYSGDAASLSYRQLGAALSLRGWYTYEKCEDNDPDFRGVAKIELKGQSILFGGIRLCGPLEEGKEEEGEEAVKAIRFWRSQYSYFYSENEIVWVYNVYHSIPDGVLAHYINLETFTDVRQHGAESRFGFGEEAWGKLLRRLRGSFESDMRLVEEGCPEDKVDKVLLHYNIDTQRGEYRALYQPGAKNVAGMTCFKRVPEPREQHR